MYEKGSRTIATIPVIDGTRFVALRGEAATVGSRQLGGGHPVVKLHVDLQLLGNAALGMNESPDELLKSGAWRVATGMSTHPYMSGEGRS